MAMIEHENANVNLDRIFEEMYNLINEASRLPLTDKILIEESDLVGLMDDLKEAIPKEVKSATQVLEEQKLILNKARTDADRIVENARVEAESIVTRAQGKAQQLVQQEEIVLQAKAAAEDIRNDSHQYQLNVKKDADDYALRVKQEALQYAEDMLDYIGKNLHSALQGIEDNQGNIAAEQRSIAGIVPQEPKEDLD